MEQGEPLVERSRGSRSRYRLAAALAALLCVALALVGCGSRGDEIILASTTSTHDSGLLDVLVPAFEAAHPGAQVKIVAVGSGEALALGRRGDADVLLVHSPADEERFMADGHGARRVPVMYNDYVIVGPPTDPARARGSDVTGALVRIAGADAAFLSRGDSSGTHRRELRLWADAVPRGEARETRVEVGQGMGETLAIASERGAYTLTDRSTYLALRHTLELDILVEGDRRLINPYSVITVRGARNAAAADAFADWVTGPGGTGIIRAFGVDSFGEPLFRPGRPPGGS